jgi:hypothetical protein
MSSEQWFCEVAGESSWEVVIASASEAIQWRGSWRGILAGGLGSGFCEVADEVSGGAGR